MADKLKASDMLPARFPSHKSEKKRLQRERQQAKIDAMQPAPEDPRQLAIDLWWFIENVAGEDADWTEKFFALRERIRRIT